MLAHIYHNEGDTLMKLLSALLMLCTISLFAGEPKPVDIGAPVPTFALNNYDGKAIDLKSVLKENKYTVIMFISTECPVSNGYNERMVSLNEKYSKKGISFLGVNANKEEDVKMIAAHCKEHGFTFPVLKDVGNKIADMYAAQVTPETFVVDAKGKLVYHGRIDDSRKLDKVKSHDLADALDALLAGKAISNPTAKAFGCTIKRVGED